MPAGEVTRKAFLAGLAAAGLFAAAAWLALTRAPKELRRIASDEPATLPPFADEAGAQVGFESFRGKVVILNLWASWCPPCIEEMPSLDRLAARLPHSGFAVLAVSQDKAGLAAAKPAFERLGLTALRLYVEPARKLTAALGARGLPTTVIFDAEGRPLSFREGPAAWDSEAMVAHLLSLAPSAGKAI